MGLMISATKFKWCAPMIAYVFLIALPLTPLIVPSLDAAPAREQSPLPGSPRCATPACKDLHPVFNQFDVIERIRYGYGMTDKDVVAFYWYRKSAESGDSRAMHNVGIMLARGMGVERDSEEGASWLQRAYENGQMSSAIALGHMRRTGSGVTRDIRLAARLYQSAADSGDVRAQHSLANLYMMGQGVAQSRVDAFVLYSLAARKGHLPAGAARDQLALLLSADELQVARWMIRSRFK